MLGTVELDRAGWVDFGHRVEVARHVLSTALKAAVSTGVDVEQR